MKNVVLLLSFFLSLSLLTIICGCQGCLCIITNHSSPSSSIHPAPPTTFIQPSIRPNAWQHCDYHLVGFVNQKTSRTCSNQPLLSFPHLSLSITTDSCTFPLSDCCLLYPSSLSNAPLDGVLVLLKDSPFFVSPSSLSLPFPSHNHAQRKDQLFFQIFLLQLWSEVKRGARGTMRCIRERNEKWREGIFEVAEREIDKKDFLFHSSWFFFSLIHFGVEDLKFGCHENEKNSRMYLRTRKEK